MKKLLFLLSPIPLVPIVIFIFFLCLSVSYCQSEEITHEIIEVRKIPRDRCVPDHPHVYCPGDYIRNAQINNNGYIVWREWIGSSWEIFLYNGVDIIRLTNNLIYDRHPCINNQNDVVWTTEEYLNSDWLEKIYLYDGSFVHKIVEVNDLGRWPQINDQGFIVWSKYIREDEKEDYEEIFLYNKGNISQVTFNNDKDLDIEHLKINNNGDIIWVQAEEDHSTERLCFYDGDSIRELYSTRHVRDFPISQNGYVVWCEGRDSGASTVILYDGIINRKEVINNPNGFREGRPWDYVNNKGQVLWAEEICELNPDRDPAYDCTTIPQDIENNQ